MERWKVSLIYFVLRLFSLSSPAYVGYSIGFAMLVRSNNSRSRTEKWPLPPSFLLLRLHPRCGSPCADFSFHVHSHHSVVQHVRAGQECLRLLHCRCAALL